MENGFTEKWRRESVFAQFPQCESSKTRSLFLRKNQHLFEHDHSVEITEIYPHFKKFS